MRRSGPTRPIRIARRAFRDAASQLIAAFAEKVFRTASLHDTVSPESFGQWEGIVKAKEQGLAFDTHDAAHLNKLRFALLDFIADFANWDNSTVPAYLETSRALTQAAHEALGGEPGTRPLVVDPFAGGGSIPLEALRVGADAFASDLNPVAVLLNKVVLEYIPKYGQQLADEVRKWGEWIKEEAEKELAEFYPKDPDGATPIAYLWARTIRCEGPGCVRNALPISALAGRPDVTSGVAKFARPTLARTVFPARKRIDDHGGRRWHFHGRATRINELPELVFIFLRVCLLRPSIEISFCLRLVPLGPSSMSMTKLVSQFWMK